jgi:VIT1/CCC1 family predicted Fe2+/Mn2+ transporter
MGNEREGKNNYSTVPEIMDSSKAADESSHERLLSSILGNSGMEGSALARMEGRHRGGGGNALRAAVLGANDGLVSNLSLVMGVAGAALENHMILITGFAGLLAGAISMALGEWISVQSSRELFEHQLAIEKEEIENSPQEEEMELSLIYQAKGIPEKQAAELAKHVLSNPETSLDTLAREELGMDPDELGGSPWVAAGSSFLLFALGAILPVIPFLFLAGLPAVVFSLCLSSLGLFLIGGGTTLFTGKHFFFSAFRMILFGLMAAGVTFGIGKLIGIAIH